MRTPGLNTALLAALLCAGAGAHAQYAWIDEKGVHQYSDKPPPTNTPASRIRNMPRGGTPAAVAPSAATPTLAEREADYRRRHAEADHAADKLAGDAKVAQQKRLRCAAAAHTVDTIATGRRLRRDVAGNPSDVMTEEDKARESARANAVLNDCR